MSNCLDLMMNDGIKESFSLCASITLPGAAMSLKDRTYNGICFFCSGCKVRGWITLAPK